jgi:transcriptional repressor NrdR
VLKRDGTRESFDRSKLLRGIIRACEKTPVTHSRIESIVDALEMQLQQSHSREISTAEIGDLVLLALRKESEVAYVRFASVYRQFQSIEDFIDTLHHLQDTNQEEAWHLSLEKDAPFPCPSP